MSSSQILLFDLSALLSNNVHFWQEVSQLGECMLPQAVFEEIQSISEGKTESSIDDPNSEAIAAEFLRFLPRSGWQVSAVMTAHPQLEPSAGHQISRRARLSLAIAQCAYGIAQLQPNTLVVLVTDEQSLLGRVNQLSVNNLGATTAMAVRQWVRTQEPPSVIKQAIAQLNVGNLKPITPSKPRAQKVAQSSATSAKQSVFIIYLSRILSQLIGLTLGIIILLFVWRLIQPQAFNQFWQKTGLPVLPSLPFDRTQPGSK